MAKRTSGFEQLVGLPWWLSLILGALAYVVLRFLLPTIEFTNPVFNAFTKAGAGFAGIVAALFFFAAALSFFLQFSKSRLLDSQTSNDSISKLSWKQFELLLSEAFRRQGYSVTENLGGGADGGVDLVLTRFGETTLVQCKNWRTASVGVTVVRELFGIVKAEGAANGIVVCSGRFTQDAIDFANKAGIQLIADKELAELISSVQKVAKFEAAPSIPACPTCGSEMVQRVAKKGKDAGKKFWGCSQYPKCKGTR